MSETALVLAGHGSHISPRTAGIVWDYVDQLRGAGAADEITACFWKEPPAFNQVINMPAARQVFIVPVFTAQGYFARQVIPAEMGLDGELTIKAGKRITLTPTLGQHRAMDNVVRDLVESTLQANALVPCDTAVAIIGHGTRRDRQSRDATREQARKLHQRAIVSQVVDVYLDDEPAIASVYSSTSARNIIALPWFLAPGSHVSIDVPRALGLDGMASPQIVRGRNVYYTPPIGLDKRICRAILELAHECGLPPQNRVPDADPWSGFPQGGRWTLLKALARRETLAFGKVMVTRSRVWHSQNSGESQAIKCPASLRAFAREQPFRPLPSADDLRAGWHVDLAHPAQAHSVLETLYPGVVADWAAARDGRFRAQPLAVTSARQVGMFKDIHLLPECLINRAVETVCGACIRQPLWHDNSASGGLPCRAACNVWLSTAARMGESV